jgi:hypothetical protein
MTNLYYFRNILVLTVIFEWIYSLDYKKNKQIKYTPHNNSTRLIEIFSSESLVNKINLGRSNFLVLFHSIFCLDCKDYLENTAKSSTYEITKGFDFYHVNCTQTKEICQVFEISTFPLFKVYLKGKNTEIVPYSPDLETILEYVDKINTPDVIDITKSMKFYSENYGDVSFLLVSNQENKEINSCYSELAKSVEYKPIFFFFTMHETKFVNREDIKLPAIIV